MLLPVKDVSFSGLCMALFNKDFFNQILNIFNSRCLLLKFTFNLFYRHLQKKRDQISGDRGLAYESLQKETNEKEHQYRIGLAYSTIPKFLKKEFPVPLSVKLYYRKRFAGENVLKSDYIGLDAVVYF